MNPIAAYSRFDPNWWVDRLAYSVAPNPYRQQVDDVTAEFDVHTFREFRRVRRLTGEYDVVGWLLSAAESDDVFYDIGANIGTHSCFVGQFVDRVFSFEPHPPTAERCRQNKTRNGIEGDTYELAFGESTGTTELSLGADTSEEVGTGEFSTISVDNPTQSLEVDCTTLDQFVAEGDVPAPDILKIDVEGAEESVLRGGSSTLSSCRVICCEVHHDRVSLDVIESLLMEAGHSVRPLGTRDGSHTFLVTGCLN